MARTVGARQGKLGILDEVPFANMRSKAPLFFHLLVAVQVRFGIEMWPHFGVQILFSCAPLC